MNYTADQKLASSTATTPASGREITRRNEPLLFTKCQAARMLSLSESSINWLLRKGSLPRHKIAGKIRFTRSDLRALIKASAVTQCYAAEQKGTRIISSVWVTKRHGKRGMRYLVRWIEPDIGKNRGKTFSSN